MLNAMLHFMSNAIPGLQIYTLLSFPARIILVLIISLVLIGMISVSTRVIWQLRQIYILRKLHISMNEEGHPISFQERIERIKTAIQPIPDLCRIVTDVEKLISQSSRHFIPDALNLHWSRMEASGWLVMIPRLTILLGFLGTLFGLTTSVENVFFKLENMQDIQSLREPIQETLSGLGVAFTTTLAGVLAALWMTPLIFLTQRMNARWKHTFETILYLDIFPVLLPEDLNFVETVRTLVEKVSRQVVEQTFGQVIKETASSVENLSVQLTDAARRTTEQRADIVSVTDTLDRAAQSMKTVSDRSFDVLGRLDERLWNLNETVSRLTPESDLRVMTIQTIGETLNQVLANQWTDLQRHLQEQMEKFQIFAEQLEQMETAFVQTVHHLEGKLDEQPNWYSLLQETITPLTQETRQFLARLETLQQSVQTIGQFIQEQWHDKSRWNGIFQACMNPLLDIQKECNVILTDLALWFHSSGQHVLLPKPVSEENPSQIRETVVRSYEESHDMRFLEKAGLPYREALSILKDIRQDLHRMIESIQGNITQGDHSIRELRNINQNIEDWIHRQEEKGKKSRLRKWMSWSSYAMDRFRKRERK